ncbi:MAG: hypothetical protein CSA58_08520 [Micrococcales bacterium]|nr:MAG: hypothetical protein CSB46_06920 [Micrococcales bacterium]PIE26603.1 MAG: hypothetical protein CSA58_08520 [Micrococcales bacterium]
MTGPSALGARGRDYLTRVRDLRYNGLAAAVAVGLPVVLLAARSAGHAMLAVPVGAIAGLLLSPLLSLTHLRALRISIQGPTRTRAGEAIRHTLVVANPRSTPSATFEVTAVSDGLSPQTVVVPSIEPRSVARVPLHRTALRRGRYLRSTLYFAAHDPLGLAAQRAVWSGEHEVIVHPRPARPAVLRPAGPVPAEDADVAGIHRGTQFAGVRGWRTGDCPRHVHWKASARHGELIVAERTHPRGQGLTLVVAGQPCEESQEHLLAQLSAAAEVHLRAREPVMLVAQQTGDPGPMVVRPQSVTQSRDWFAGLAHVLVPDPDRVRAVLPTPAPTAVVAAFAEIDPQWLSTVRGTGTHRGTVDLIVLDRS